MVALGSANELRYLIGLSHRLAFLSKRQRDLLDEKSAALTRSLEPGALRWSPALQPRALRWSETYT